MQALWERVPDSSLPQEEFTKALLVSPLRCLRNILKLAFGGGQFLWSRHCFGFELGGWQSHKNYIKLQQCFYRWASDPWEVMKGATNPVWKRVNKGTVWCDSWWQRGSLSYLGRKTMGIKGEPRISLLYFQTLPVKILSAYSQVSLVKAFLGASGLSWVTKLVPLTCTFALLCQSVAIPSSWASVPPLLPQALLGANGSSAGIPRTCALDAGCQDVVGEILILSCALVFSFSECRPVGRSLLVREWMPHKGCEWDSSLRLERKGLGKIWGPWDKFKKKLTFCWSSALGQWARHRLHLGTKNTYPKKAQTGRYWQTPLRDNLICSQKRSYDQSY